jgi:hypothetical protein
MIEFPVAPVRIATPQKTQCARCSESATRTSSVFRKIGEMSAPREPGHLSPARIIQAVCPIDFAAPSVFPQINDFLSIVDQLYCRRPAAQAVFQSHLFGFDLFSDLVLRYPTRKLIWSTKGKFLSTNIINVINQLY